MSTRDHNVYLKVKLHMQMQGLGENSKGKIQ